MWSKKQQYLKFCSMESYHWLVSFTPHPSDRALPANLAQAFLYPKQEYHPLEQPAGPLVIRPKVLPPLSKCSANCQGCAAPWMYLACQDWKQKVGSFSPKPAAIFWFLQPILLNVWFENSCSLGFEKVHRSEKENLWWGKRKQSWLHALKTHFSHHL